MDDDLMKQIVTICKRMDEYSIDIYHNLSRAAENEDLKKFWAQMSREELQHVTFWQDILEMTNRSEIPQIFENPGTTLKELNENFKKIVDISEQSTSSIDLTENFVLAFRLEFYLLHSALEGLWNFYGIIHKDEYTPEKEYANHIHSFITAMRKFGAATIELEALGEAIERIWSHGKIMAKKANFDYLTTILNRHGFFNAMVSLATLAKRNGFNSAVLMIDIDHFKSINDTLGHQSGDTVLRMIADTIKSNIRLSDILGRYGGDEYIVYLPQIEEKSVQPIAEKIRKSIQSITSLRIPVTVSIGGVCKNITGNISDEIENLISQADAQLYEAKRKGRNRVIC